MNGVWGNDKLVAMAEAIARIEVKCDDHAAALNEMRTLAQAQNGRVRMLENITSGHTRLVAVLSAFTALLVSVGAAGILRHFGW
jgi:hypothetical protein